MGSRVPAEQLSQPENGTYVEQGIIFEMAPVRAKQMILRDYLKLRGWKTHPLDDPEENGYLVEHTDQGPPNVSGFSGFVRWIPQGLFERDFVKVPSTTH